MSRVIVAVGDPADVRELIRSGRAIATLWDAETVAVHVSGAASTDMAAHLRRQEASLNIHPGEPRAVIAALAAQAGVDAVVVGAGTDRTRLGVSPFTEALVTELSTPVLVIPSDCPGVTTLRRVLVPLEGGADNSPLLTRWLAAMHDHGVAARMLHVHAPVAVPAFADHEPHASEAWNAEFLSRQFTSDTLSSELLRDVGMPAEEIVALCRPDIADLVVLSWGRAPAEGRARVVADTLSRGRIPVLLLAADTG